MAYNKNVWVNGISSLSAQELNNIESGIENAHESINDIFEQLDNIKNNEGSVKDNVPLSSITIENTFISMIDINGNEEKYLTQRSSSGQIQQIINPDGTVININYNMKRG